MAATANAIWRARPSGSNTNGGGYDASLSGAGTDYSQQNTAQASGTHGTISSASTTFADTTAAAFTSAMVGNAMYITGTGLITGWYFVVTFTDSGHVVLDRTPWSTGTVTTGTWHLGGGWADWWTNPSSAAATASMAQGNIVYALGSGTPNPSSYTYDYTISTAVTINIGYGNYGLTFANDPATPGYKAAPDTTGGMPVTKWNMSGGGGGPGASTPAIANSETQIFVNGMWIVATANVSAGDVFFETENYTAAVFNGCVFDQFGRDVIFATSDGTYGYVAALGCEAYSSTGGTGGVWSPFVSGNISSGGSHLVGCNIHNCVGNGWYVATGQAGYAVAVNSIFAKNNGDGVVNGGNIDIHLQGCVIDGNGGNGFNGAVGGAFMTSCIISNHTGAGKYGITLVSAAYFPYRDFTTYYNNTADINTSTVLGGNGSGYMPHDTHGGSNPFVGQSTQNYALA